MSEPPIRPTGRLRGLSRRRGVRLATVGFVVYLATRSVGLDRFPAYFFADEAVQTTLADGLLHNGLRDERGVLLPPFLRNVFRYNLSVSVYAQVLPTWLFGRSVWVTRATSVLIGSLVVPGVCVALRMLKVRTWWIGAFVVASIPVWFLHSRTAFEVAMATGFFACFLAAYLWYRLRSPQAAPLVVVTAALTAYSYASAQGLVVVTCALLVCIDATYHWARRNDRRLLVRTAVVTVVCLLPYVRHRRLHPDDSADQLKALGSYWYSGESLGWKLGRFVDTYLAGIDPRYWFGTNNTVDPSRHVMVGMGHVWWVLAPFALVGLLACLWRWRSPGHRVVLVALVAAPFSAALVDVIVTRLLMTVVPIVLLVCIGIEESLRLASTERSRSTITGIVAAALVLLTVGMTSTSLDRGDTWTSDYGMSGLQWGGQQVYAEVQRVLDADPAAHVVIGSDWANSPQVLADFFVDDADRSRVNTADFISFFTEQVALPPETTFVLSPYDLDRVVQSGKIELDPVSDVIRRPDGEVGFTVVRGRYVDDIDAIYAAERAARNVLQTTQAEYDGIPVELSMYALDRGSAEMVVDGDPDTLVRGLESNPFVVEMRFEQPVTASEVEIGSWSTRTRVQVVITDAEGEVVSDVTADFAPDSDNSVFTLDVSADGAPVAASVVRIEMTDLSLADVAHIHVREIRLR